MFGETFTELIAEIMAGLVLALLGAVFVWARHHLRGFGRMIKDWNGEPDRPGIRDGVPGVMQRLYNQDRQFDDVLGRLDKQDTQLIKIEHEIEYNHGGSIKDAVHRTDAAIGQLREDVQWIKSGLESK